MKTFKYKTISKLFYKYGVIPANLILLFYLIGSIIGFTGNWLFVIPLFISGIMIYVLNKFYIKIYKSFPFKIDINNEKLICSDFMIKNKVVEIQHSEITKISGSIFSGRTYLPLNITTKDEEIGISPHIKDYNDLLKVILTNIPKELYESLLNDITKFAVKKRSPKEEKKKK